ncbi:MAG: phosphatidate cytidylyltransferase [Gammaproteobacteria bacterium]|nr:phosphatidate cytidylyltransferase [Gammaproteobacteria bacterium]
MLKHRILTALILIPLVVAGIFKLSNPVFSAILSVFVLLGAWEWAALIGWKQPVQRIAYAAVVAAILVYFAQGFASPEMVDTALFISVGWWIAGMTLIAKYRGETGIQHSQVLLNALIGVILLIPTWLAITVLHSNLSTGPAQVLYLMILIWGADSGAYFVGRKYGRRKLAPHVSPGKSVEGAMGAFATCALISFFGSHYFALEGPSIVTFLLVSLLTVAFSIEGDLMESLFKRRAGVKDSGTLLPGHGGVLDRIDSLTAAAPVFAVGISFMERVA